MKKHLPFLAFAIYVLAATFYAGPAFCDNAYQIILKNGETIVVRHYEIQGEDIILYKSWGSISFKRSEVAKIKKESYTPSNEDDNPEQSIQHKKPGRKSKPKNDHETELAKCQKRLKMSRNSMRIYCGQAESIKIAPPPNLPQANRSRVSEKTAEQFKAHVQSKVHSYKAQESCNYYKDLVAELEKKCGGY